MSEFTTPLKVMPVDGGLWRLLEAFKFYTSDGDWLIEVPEGFLTDFGSIPRALWALWPPYHPSYGKATVIHDYLYVHQHDHEGNRFSRRWADSVLMDGMVVLGAPRIRRRIFYIGIRLFGWIPWWRYGRQLDAKTTRRAVVQIAGTRGH